MLAKFRLILIFLLSSIIIIALTYLFSRVIYVFGTEVNWYEKASLIVLLSLDLFIVIHSIGYTIEVLRVLIIKKKKEDLEPSKLLHYPPVAILIPACKEPLNIIRNTLICCKVLSYPNKVIYLLDDTRYNIEENKTPKMQKYKEELDALCQELKTNLFRHEWKGAKAGILNDCIEYLEKRAKKGSFCVYNREGTKNFSPKYVAVLDADQNPFIDYLEPIIKKLEEDSKIAFIQSPQYYTNFNKNKVANAAGIQQAIFYEYICESKGLLKAVLCCGTNIIYNKKALISIGGFDEISVTEDMSTSFEFHVHKWKSIYLNKVSIFGMGPENLASYFTQQYRWSLGTLGVMRKLVITLLKKPFSLSPYLWWEYFLSSSFYLIGFVYFILSLFPISFILFNFPSYVSGFSLSLLVFPFYLIMTFLSFLWSIRSRGYSFKDIILGQWLLLSTFPVYMKAALHALFNRREKFVITSKEGRFTIPLHHLWPQLGLALLCFFSTIWGLNRIYFAREPFSSLCFNTFWCFYNFIILFSLVFFNYTPDKK